MTNVRIAAFFALVALPCLVLGAGGRVVDLNPSNFNEFVGEFDVVLVNFYANWCKFSKMLEPIYEQTAVAVKEMERVGIARVDCEAEGQLAEAYNIRKYPTIKIFRNGKMAKKEYRGVRSVEGFSEFIKREATNPVMTKGSFVELNEAFTTNRRVVVGFFENDVTGLKKIFYKVASELRDDCVFVDAASAGMAAQYGTSAPKIIFKQQGAPDSFYSGVNDERTFQTWASELCVPLVREITFENGEEMVEEGLPFLILFHHPDDHDSVKKFTEIVQSTLHHERRSLNFLTADGLKFAHPLHHLDNNAQPPQPAAAVDQPVPAADQPLVVDNNNNVQQPPVDMKKIEIVESTFKNLAPSKKRYSIPRDEL
eukprot:Colp12_sorted_trinity150504_noHs@12545